MIVAAVPREPTTQDKTNLNEHGNEGLENNAPFNAAISLTNDLEKTCRTDGAAIQLSIGGPTSKNHPKLRLVLFRVVGQWGAASTCARTNLARMQGYIWLLPKTWTFCNSKPGTITQQLPGP